MKLLKYLMYISVFTYCGCSYAAPKEKISNLACPYILPAKKDFPVGWVVLGEIPADKLQIRNVGIILGNAAEEKNRIFDEEIIEEWDNVNGTAQAAMEYEANHEDRSLKCVYAKSDREASDNNPNSVVLLIPLPPKKAISCLIVKRDVKPEVEISCNVK